MTKQEYLDFYEALSPRTSDEEFIGAVCARRKELFMSQNTDQQAKKKKILSKAAVIPIAAAIALSTTTVVMGATNNWDYAKVFENIFGAKKEASAEAFDFDGMGVSVDRTFSVEGTTANVMAAIADDNAMCVMTKVEFSDEAAKYINVGEPTDPHSWYIDISPVDYKLFSMSYTIPYEADGNTVTYISTFIRNDAADIHGRNVKFVCDGIKRLDLSESYEYICMNFDEDANFDVLIEKNDKFSAKTAECEAPLYNNTQGKFLSAQKAVLSPLSLNMSATFDKAGDHPYFKNDERSAAAVITLDDGSTIEAKGFWVAGIGGPASLDGSGDSTGYNYSYTYAFIYPVKIENVKSIAIDELVVNF